MRHSGVVLSTSDDLMLSGEVFMPDDIEKIYPAVCICHGIPASAHQPDDDGGYPALAARFTKAGFVSLVFQFRGAGFSQGNFDINGWTIDLKSAIDFLYMLPEVDKKKICLLGSSAGAAVSIFNAAQDMRVACVACLACPAEFNFFEAGYVDGSMISRFREIGIIRDADFPTSEEKWLEAFSTIKPLDYIAKISPRPVLLIHGEIDETVPVEHARRLFDQAREPKEKVIITGAGHRLRHDDNAVKSAMDWLIARMAEIPESSKFDRNLPYYL